MSTGLFDYHIVQPLARFGLTGPFWSIHSEIVIGTWVAMSILLVITVVGRFFMTRKKSPGCFVYERAIELFIKVSVDNIGTFNKHYFCFVTSLFLFTLFSCVVGLIPFIEESTRDLNTTLAIALCSFSYVQYQKIALHGLKGYLREFIEPFVVMAPLHVVGEISKIASMSFRLFGNIVGGGVILGMVITLCSDYRLYLTPIIFGTIALHFVFECIPYKKNILLLIAQKIISTLLNVLFCITWIQIILGIGEAMIQSFVLTMLTATYLGMALQHGTDEQHEHDKTDAQRKPLEFV
jgi:F-type H+-transporting ATPase subunit a